MIDICSLELCSYIPSGAAENRINKAILLEQHASVIGTLTSVVEGEDALVLLVGKVCSWVLPAVSVVGR